MKLILTALIGLLLAVSASAQRASVTLTWDPNPEADLGGYRIYWGPSSRAYTNLMDSGRLTTNRVTNLLDGVTYYFAVTAYSTNGLESDYSNEVAILTKARPSPPSNLGGSQSRDVVMGINWRGRTNANGTVVPVAQIELADASATIQATIVTQQDPEQPGVTQSRTVKTTNRMVEIVGRPARPPFAAWVVIKSITTPSTETSSFLFQ